VSKTGKEFIEKTKYKYLDKSDQMKKVTQPPLQQPYDQDKRIIELPIPGNILLGNISLRQAIDTRRSIRKYSQEPIKLVELTYLLWTTQGVSEIKEGNVNYTLRTVPSAGARHALETYLLVNNISDLERGIYRYLALENKLVELNTEQWLDDKFTKACLGQKIVKTSAVTFIWVAVPYRMKWRYSERAYRYLHLDAGHVCQNLYLASEGINSGVCAIAAFSDNDVNKILQLDGEEQFVIYMATVGKK